MNSVRIQNYSGPHFPTFGLNTERYAVFLRIQSECRKMKTRISPNTNTFCTVQIYIIGRRNFEIGKCKILVKRLLHKNEAVSRFTSWYGTNLKIVFPAILHMKKANREKIFFFKIVQKIEWPISISLSPQINYEYNESLGFSVACIY